MNTPPLLPRRILAGTILSLLALSPCTSRGEAFTTTLDAPNGGGTMTYNWTTLTWSIAGEYPGLDDLDDAVTVLFREFNGVDGGGTAVVQVDLEGGTYTLGSLLLNESSVGETGGMFQNGTFNLSSITQASAGNFITFSSTTTVASGATPLSISQSADFRSITFAGAVTGTGGLAANIATTAGRIVFNQAMYNVTGGLTISGLGAFRFDQFTGDSSKSIDGLNFNGTGELEIDRVSGSTSYNLTIDGPLNVNSSRLRMLANDTAGEFIFNGTTTVDNNGNGVELGTNGQRTVVRINAALNDSLEGDRLRLAPHLITNSNSGNFGTIIIGAGVTTNRTGDTDFFTTGVLGDNFQAMGGKVVLNGVSAAGTGLGPGQINVGNGISLGNHLNVVANHGAALDVDLKPFNIISGDLTGANYAQTPTLADELAIGTGDRIFVNGTLGLPTTSFTGGATHYLGIPANTGTFTVGDDGNVGTTGDIFKGVAFGSTISTVVQGAFAGTVNTFSGSAPLPVLVFGQVFGSTGTATFDTTGAVSFIGPGAMILDKPASAPRAVNLDIINRVGNFESQNNNVVILADANALNAGQTLNASFGRVDLNAATSVESGAAVVIGEMGTLSLDLAPTTGTFTIGQGGMALLTGTGSIAFLEGGATFNVSGSNAALILNAEGAVGTQLAALMPQVDIILGGVFNVDDFDGAGIRLGPGKRFTLASTTDTSALTGGAGLSTTAVAGETVYLSAPSGRTLDLNDPINLGLANVEIGSATPVTSIVAQGNVARFTAMHTGAVNFDGNSTAHDVTLQSGTLNFNGTGANGSASFSGTFTLNPGTIGFVSDDSPAELDLIDGSFATGGVRVNDGARLEFEFDQQVGGISVQTPFTFSGSAANSPTGVQLIVDEEGPVSGTDSSLFTINQLRLTDGTTFALNESDAAVVRAGLKIGGTATVVDNTNGDDFDLMSVIGVDGTGAIDTIGAKSLTLGDTSLASDTFLTTLLGAIASNVTVQLNNAQITLAEGASLSGKLSFAGRIGPDSDILIRAGQTGTNFLAGTGQIDLALGEDVETLVDELDAGDPPNPSLALIENVVGQRINVLAAETGVLRSNRGINANDAQDVFGNVTYSEVHLAAGSSLSIAPGSAISVRVGLVLDGSASVSGTDGARSFIGSILDPGSEDILTITGPNVRLVGPAVAGAIVVGGAVSATLSIHPSNAQPQTVTTGNGTATYPLLAGPRVTPTLTLSDALVVGMGGIVNLGIDNIEDGAYTISTGLRLSDNADVNIYTPVVIPAGKRFEGSTSIPVLLDDASATDTGALRIEGTIAPGSLAIPAGTLSLQDGFVTMADGSVYQFQAGIDALSGDLVRLTGSTSKLAFEGTWTLELGATSTFDPTGKSFLLFDAATAITSLGTPTLLNTVAGWDISGATISISGNDVVLQGVVPEPTTGIVFGVGLGLFGAVRRRRAR